MNYFQNLFRFLWMYLLCIPRIGNWLILIVLQTNMTQSIVGNVLYINPPHIKPTLPFILYPNPSLYIKIDFGFHLSDTAEMSAAINAEQQIHWSLNSLLLLFFVSLVQSSITMFRRCPA